MTMSASFAERDEEYRTREAECQQSANYWCETMKQQYEDLANQWRVIAAQAKRQRAAFATRRVAG